MDWKSQNFKNTYAAGPSVNSRADGGHSVFTETANQKCKGVTEITHKDSIKMTLDVLWVETRT